MFDDTGISGKSHFNPALTLPLADMKKNVVWLLLYLMHIFRLLDRPEALLQCCTRAQPLACQRPRSARARSMRSAIEHSNLELRIKHNSGSFKNAHENVGVHMADERR